MTGFERFSEYHSAKLLEAFKQLTNEVQSVSFDENGHNRMSIGCKSLMPLAPLPDSQPSNPGSIPGSATSLSGVIAVLEIKQDP